MHSYLRAIGFSQLKDRKKLKEILTNAIMTADKRGYTMNSDNVMLGEFCKDFADNMGIAVCGEFDEEDKFVYEYYYPYLRGQGVTTTEDVSVERHAARDSYAGVVEDVNMGISMIFYLQNMIPYVNAQTAGRLPVRGTTLTLSGLSLSGKILMPIHVDEEQKDQIRRRTIARNQLIEEARKGSEEAMETLTLEDMDTYSTINARIRNEDVFSIVDTFFMPYGMECDQYSVMGEIVGMRKVKNSLTGEEVYVLTICSNELTFDVCINIIDLLGEPQVGRRFKGNIWLQGFINFPDDV
ncbi:MAG: DUF3881 family protein [Lachnospiraceae bacterium]|nr:DUF3881 family protein [Lachnospiraceae bacterium]MBQ2101500.1 DUF3881 family protein [Lachnospiraceae bacterium]MBQ3905527.1 DUF3881 family protein [Lachnospiraceae bacterium]